MVAFFASVLLAVSTYAKNSREAQTYMGTVYLIVLLPAVFSQVLGFTDIGSQMWVNFVPVLGTTANIRQAFQGKTNLAGVGESILVGVVLALVMFRIAVYLFNREEVLVRV
jgi:sodium transport system permease protein